jgi:hypothetical protein
LCPSSCVGWPWYVCHTPSTTYCGLFTPRTRVQRAATHFIQDSRAVWERDGGRKGVVGISLKGDGAGPVLLTRLFSPPDAVTEGRRTSNVPVTTTCWGSA